MTVFFFFQAEDGIRDADVTGVQTCALPIFGISLEAGEIVSIIGPNGAGKSTLLKVIAGILAPSRGSVHLRGVPIHGRRPREIRDRKSTRLNSSHVRISYAVFCLKKKFYERG